MTANIKDKILLLIVNLGDTVELFAEVYDI